MAIWNTKSSTRSLDIVLLGPKVIDRGTIDLMPHAKRSQVCWVHVPISIGIGCVLTLSICSLLP